MHDGGGVGCVGALTFTPRTLFYVRSEPSLTSRTSLEVGPLILTPLKFYAIFFSILWTLVCEMFTTGQTHTHTHTHIKLWRPNHWKWLAIITYCLYSLLERIWIRSNSVPGPPRERRYSRSTPSNYVIKNLFLYSMEKNSWSSELIVPCRVRNTRIGKGCSWILYYKFLKNVHEYSHLRCSRTVVVIPMRTYKQQ